MIVAEEDVVRVSSSAAGCQAFGSNAGKNVFSFFLRKGEERRKRSSCVVECCTSVEGNGGVVVLLFLSNAGIVGTSSSVKQPVVGRGSRRTMLYHPWIRAFVGNKNGKGSEDEERENEH